MSLLMAYNTTRAWNVLRTLVQQAAKRLSEYVHWRAKIDADGASALITTSAEMCSGSEEGWYLRLIDFCITQL